MATPNSDRTTSHVRSAAIARRRHSLLVTGVLVLCTACGGDDSGSNGPAACPVEAGGVESCLVVTEVELIPGRGPLLTGELVLGAVATDDELCLLDSSADRVAVAVARVIEIDGQARDQVSAPASDVGILVPGTPEATAVHVAVRPPTICAGDTTG